MIFIFRVQGLIFFLFGYTIGLGFEVLEFKFLKNCKLLSQG